MSFKLENVTVKSSLIQTNYDSAPKIFPEFISGSVILSSPQSNSYETNLPITAYGTLTNMTQADNYLYCDYASNFQLITSINITVPSASLNNPVYLCFYPSFLYDNGSDYYSYSYNTFKATSNKAQNFTFTNYFQNT